MNKNEFNEQRHCRSSRQFYESANTIKAFCNIFEPDSTFLQPQLDVVVLTLYPFPADKPKDFASFESQLDGFANLLTGALSSLWAILFLFRPKYDRNNKNL